MSETETQYYSANDQYQQLLEYMKGLFKRQNLCNNTYLYKKMNGTLSVPLYIIVEERNVASISKNYEDIIDAIQNSGLAHVVKNKEVKIIEYPTVKISMKSFEGQGKLEEMLTEKEKKFEISKRTDTQQFINLTVFSENIIWLEKLIQKVDKQILYQRASLLQDIEFGVDRIRKLKFQHAKVKTTVGKVQYSLNNPPKIFVRKALQSSDQQSQPDQHNVKNPNQSGRHPSQRIRLNQNRQRKPRINAQDFPLLK